MLKEDKEKYPIYVFIHKDKVTISIDTTGDALHKRGYREKANKAPIRETISCRDNEFNTMETRKNISRSYVWIWNYV